MRDEDQVGWIVMLGSLAVMSVLVLALVYLPGVQPSEEVLACDRDGGYWSAEEGRCHETDSPLAGLAA